MFQINEDRLRWLEEHEPEKFRQAQVLLEQIKRLRESNPLQFFEPYPKQLAFLVSREPVQAFFGGNRAGKTTTGVVKTLVQCVDVDCLPEHLRPAKKVASAQGRVINPSVSLQEESVLPTFRRWAPKDQLHGGSFGRAWDKQQRVLRFKNGSQIKFQSFEQDLDKFGGASLDFVLYDEEPPLDIRNENMLRLVDRDGFEMFAMTPLQGMSWMFDGVYERRHEDGFCVVQASIDDNPNISASARDRILAGLTKEEREARQHGRFVHFKGLVFSEFRDQRHVVPRPDRERIRSMDVIVGIDPGIRWTGVSWHAFDSDNGMLTFADRLLTDATVPVVAEEIRKVNNEWGLADPMYVIDPAARNRVATTAEQIQAAYLREGISAYEGQNSVEAGINELKRRLQSEDARGEPAPMWQVSQECQRLIWEIGRYRWNDEAQTQVVKVEDHVLDSTRYAAMMRPWFGSVEVKPRRWWGMNEAWPPPRPTEAQHPLGSMV